MNQPLLLALLAFCLPSPSLQAQVREVFSHEDWRAVLENYVDPQGRVDYLSLAEDREDLDRYVQAIRKASPENRPDLFVDRDDQLAYYLNAYNALVIVGVLELGAEVSSVWGKSGLGIGFFAKRHYELGQKRLSLKKLEDLVIREEFRDPRIHAALNCASLDCPRLQIEPFLGVSLQAQLEAAMREWVSAPRTVQLDRERETVTLSKIFSWFRKDFLEATDSEGSSPQSIAAFINRYRPSDSQIPLSFREQFRPYDKRLNSTP